MSAASAGIASERTPVASVITPAYNAETFIAETIASVQAQSLGHWEMLVADPASADRTAAIVEAAAAAYPRIRIIRCTQPGAGCTMAPAPC